MKRSFGHGRAAHALAIPSVKAMIKSRMRNGLYIPLLAYAAGVLFIFLAGYQAFRQFESLLQRDKLNDLNAIAIMKSRQIVSWREARLRDGAVLSRATLLPAEFERWLSDAGPHDTRRQKISAVLGSWAKLHGYRNIALMDRQGALRFAMEGTAVPEDEDVELGRRAMASGEAILSDIHNKKGGREIVIDLAAPLIVHENGGSRVVGAALMQVNPEDFLFPLIREWPVASRTAETLLVRQEGEQLRFLNVLRHRQGKAMELRLPIDTPDLPPGMFLRGKLDPFNSVDYRRVPVVAVVTRVPGTPWLMVAKTDKDEVLAPITTLKQWSVAVGLIFLTACGTLLYIWLQGIQTRYRYLKDQRDAAIHRELLLKHFEYLTKYANDIIFVADENGEIIEANERAVSVYGYTRTELLGKQIWMLRPPSADLSVYHQQMAQLRETGQLIFETVNRRKDGTTFPVEVSARVIDMEGGEKYLQGIIRDISERKLAERRIARLNDLYATIIQTNSTIVRVKERTLLFQEICRIVVEHGHFLLAWIGMADPQRGLVVPVASSGIGKGYLDGLAIPLDPARPEGQGPTGRALHDCRAVICNDFEADPSTLPWRDRARSFGLRSSTAWPLTRHGESVGVLTLYADEVDYFDHEMVQLLSSVSQDISFALDNLAMEDSLRHSEERFRTLVENLPQSIFLKDRHSVYVSCNGAYARALGIGPPQITGMTDFDFYPPELAEKYRLDDRRVLDSGEVEDIQEEFIEHGQRKTVHTIKAPFRNGAGEVIGVLGVFWDITERKQAENELVRQKSFFRQVIDADPNLIFVKDESGKLLLANQAIAALYGMTPEEMLGDKYLAKLTGRRDEAEVYLAMDREVIRTHRAISFIHPSVLGGEERWFHSTKTPLELPDGTMNVLGISMDITERKRAEDELRKSAEQIEDLYNNAPCGYHSLDRDGMIRLINNTELQWLGYTREEVVDRMNIRDFHAPSSRERFRDAFGKFKESGSVAGLEFEFLRRDGSVLPVVVNATAIYGADGEFVMSRTTVFDDSERRLAQASLRESEARFHAMADNAPIIIWMADAQGGQTYSGCGFFNRRWHDFTGLSLTETQGKNWLDLVHPDDRARTLTAYQEGFRLAEPFKHEFRLRRHDGEYRWMFDSGVPRFTGNGEFLGFIGTCVDVTEQKNSEALRNEIERAGRLNIAVEMASGLAHELSQPLTAANNYLTACLHRMKESEWDKEKLRQAVELTHKQTERAGNIINHLKSLIRKQGRERTVIDINALIRDTVDFLEHEIRQGGIRVSLALAPLPAIPLNKVEIEQVLINLIKNAIDAMHGVSDPELRISTRLDILGRILVSVADNGQGIAAADLATIFNPFDTSKNDGLGLGLAICRSLVENHDGRIWAEAQPGLGAEFHFTLPFEGNHPENLG